MGEKMKIVQEGGELVELRPAPKVRIFVVCSVRIADNEYRNRLEKYVGELESSGHTVHLPHRDTKQDMSGIDICSTNAEAILRADEVHIFYTPESQGTHFDMGVAFALKKRIRVVECLAPPDGKSFSRMLREWEEKGGVK